MPNKYTYRSGEILPSKTKERKRIYQRNYRKKHPEKSRELCRKYRIKNKDILKKKGQEYRNKLRLEVLKYYSGENPICECCNENHMEFLTIDHINGGGNKHRKSIAKNLSGWQFYLWLKRNNYPKGFQVLCMNCNFAKGHGGCPHNEKKE